MNWLKGNGDLLFRPFPLEQSVSSKKGYPWFQEASYSSIFVSFNLRLLLLVSTSKSPLVDQLREFLLDEIVDLFHGEFKSSLGSTSNVEV